MRIGMVGHGMMGVWHSDALQAIPGIELHTLVGRRPEPTAEFAARYGYRRWTLDLAEMLADPAIDAVIIASPSEAHAEHALLAIAAKKPPIAPRSSMRKPATAEPSAAPMSCPVPTQP